MLTINIVMRYDINEYSISSHLESTLCAYGGGLYFLSFLKNNVYV